MVSPTKELIEKFYAAFAQKDAESMIACYDDDIVFRDPAFGQLKGEDAKNMWRMLCQNAGNMKIEVSAINASLKKGSAHWEAWYTFSKTHRKVHNIIEAEFEFKNSRIIQHTDNFDFHRWASQAMGWKGWLLGGTRFFQNKFRERTSSILAAFREKRER
jgi:limonene-1,2-epoxide hydrolase